MRYNKLVFFILITSALVLATLTSSTVMALTSSSHSHAESRDFYITKAREIAEQVLGINTESARFFVSSDEHSDYIDYEVRLEFPDFYILFWFDGKEFWACKVYLYPINLKKNPNALVYNEWGIELYSSANPIIIAKNVLTKYERLYNASYCHDMITLLNRIKKLRNMTIKTENLVLKLDVWNFSHQHEIYDFKWIHRVKGVEAPRKRVRVSVKHIASIWFTEVLGDGWKFFRIGTTEINISRDEAISIALNRTENYMKQEGITNYQVTTIMANCSFVPRPKGSYELYPRWRIECWIHHSDKRHPDLRGYWVFIWADTGDIEAEGPTMVYTNQNFSAIRNFSSMSIHDTINIMVIIGIPVASFTLATLLVHKRHKITRRRYKVTHRGGRRKRFS